MHNFYTINIYAYIIIVTIFVMVVTFIPLIIKLMLKSTYKFFGKNFSDSIIHNLLYSGIKPALIKIYEHLFNLM